GRQTVFWGECLKIQKRQLIRNELVALNFPISGISPFPGCNERRREFSHSLSGKVVQGIKELIP
ncbi:hypothetical protein, partial [Bacteroides xylanisolvens]|uniref:hypothetical protein n=1 Tax=Bacteroides xylanisolvens TaxID=371601 RepID=UPI001E38004E